jgi:hypothetical protein
MDLFSKNPVVKRIFAAKSLNMISTLPEYSVFFNNAYKPCVLIQKILPPKDVKVSPKILNMLSDLAQEFVSHQPPAFDTKFQRCKIAASLNEGLVIEGNERILNCFKEMYGGLCAVVEEEQAKLAGLDKVRQLTPGEKAQEEAKRSFPGKNVIYFDPFAIAMFRDKISDPIEMHFNIHYITSPGKRLKTGCLQFPHLLKDLHDRLNTYSQDMHCCIVGSDLVKMAGGLPFSPQLAELMLMFPEAHFLILDNNKKTVDSLKKYLNQRNRAIYDPTLLKYYLQEHTNEPKYALKQYRNVFTFLKENLIKHSQKPKNAKKAFYSINENQQIFFKAQSKKIEVSEFEIYKSLFSESQKRPFDLIVATYSISVEFGTKLQQNIPENHFAVLAKFLDALKENGSLYIDMNFLRILKLFLSQTEVNLCINYIEMILGNKLKIEDIPLSDFVIGNKEAECALKSMTKSESDGFVISSSITKFTRLPEKVNLSEDEKVKLQLELVKALTQLKSGFQEKNNSNKI